MPWGGGGSEQHCRFPPLAQGAMWSRGVRVPPHWLLTSQSGESSWGLWALWYKDANPFWTLPRDLAYHPEAPLLLPVTVKL